jgi:hypothetical protein
MSLIHKEQLKTETQDHRDDPHTSFTYGTALKLPHHQSIIGTTTPIRGIDTGYIIHGSKTYYTGS